MTPPRDLGLLLASPRRSVALIAADLGVFIMKQLLAGLALAALGAPALAMPTLVEGFDDISLLGAAGWSQANNSTPGGSTSWFQGNTGVLPASSGAADSYIASNYLAAGFGGTVSNWLITPMLTLHNGDVLSFVVRVAGDGFLDTLETRLSLSGASSDVGATAGSVGDFAVLLGSYSSSTDGGWVTQNYTVSGLAGDTLGRLAFRYLVGDTSVDGNYIGVDTVQVNTAGARLPEPGTLALSALALAGLWRGRRRA
jgi:hypothetical protein